MSMIEKLRRAFDNRVHATPVTVESIRRLEWLESVERGAMLVLETRTTRTVRRVWAVDRVRNVVYLW